LKSSIPGQQSKSTSTTPTARAPTASTTNTQRAPDPHLTALINSLSVMHASSVARKQVRFMFIFLLYMIYVCGVIIFSLICFLCLNDIFVFWLIHVFSLVCLLLMLSGAS
jgi:type IV secretory pathway TrbL component